VQFPLQRLAPGQEGLLRQVGSVRPTVNLKEKLLRPHRTINRRGRYLEIYRNNPADSQWVLVHKTEVIKKTLGTLPPASRSSCGGRGQFDY
jgi:hypothetical protein